MKTSVIEVHDMLSVLTVDEVEKRIGEVPGVESATVNYAAGNATVRYDETLLSVADIKVLVHQRGKQSAGDGQQNKAVPDGPPSAAAEPKPPQDALVDAPTPAALAGGGKSNQAPPSTPVAAKPKPPADVSAATPASTPDASPADEHKDHEEQGALGKATTWVRDTITGGDKGQAEPGAQTSTRATDVPKAAPEEPATVPKTAPAASVAEGYEGHEGHEGHAKSGAQPAMSADMAHEMGHSGTDLPAMVRDMRNRFWICLIFTVPIFVYAPMGDFFLPPAPPFGLDIDLWLFSFASAAILYPSWPFFVSAWRAVRKGTLGMAALIVLSVGTGYVFSVGSTFFFKQGGQFFEAVAMLLVFILLGHWLEMRARAGASSAITALMDLAPAQASVIRNGAEVEVPTAEVLAGDGRDPPG